MKHKIIYINFFVCTIIILCSAQSILSQETSQNKGKQNFGFETGIQFIGIDDPYMQISKSGIGYNLGPFIEQYISEFIKIRGGVQLDNRGFTLKHTEPVMGDSGYIGYSSYIDIKKQYKVNYLTIPLSIIYIKGNENFSFFLQGTLYYSFYLGSVQTGYSDVYISETDAPHYYFEDYPELNDPGHHYFDPVINKFNSSDMGINMFFGGIFHVKHNLGLSISPGFTYSFANVWEDPQRNVKWSRIYKVTAGLVYTIK
ncbi:MAG: outer membrane beta-barrel protein [Bacteroidetes bacterium]|nr:outer membrane beta-barrel protein [Bacteroidota bacterium]